jgi:transcriptional regulator with XRE-family HTH domain
LTYIVITSQQPSMGVDVSESFGSALRRLRIERHLSQADFARNVSYTPGWLSKLENGRAFPSRETAALLDAALDAGGALEAHVPSLAVPADSDAVPWDTAELIRRVELSDVSASTLEMLAETIERLCCEYATRSADDLRAEGHQWLRYLHRLLDGRLSLRTHRELVVLAGWLALLLGCVEYDLGLKSAAETTRGSALSLGKEAGHTAIIGWAYEMAAWFALTDGAPDEVVRYATAGQDACQSHSVAVQLIAQEAKALARLGRESDMHGALDRGSRVLDHLPRPDRPSNHFVIDPAKWDFYAMDCYRVIGDNARAADHARRVIEVHTLPDGTERSPMRISEARFTLAHVALRSGDLEEAVTTGRAALGGSRRSLPHMRMSAREFLGEVLEHHSHERLAVDFREHVNRLMSASAPRSA